MAVREQTALSFELTLKGVEELKMRTYRLDAKVRNILFMIQRGVATTEGIMEPSIFPREDVVDRLKDLLRSQFIVLRNAAIGAGASNTIQRMSEAASPTAMDAGAAKPAPKPAEEQSAEPAPVIYFGL